MLPPIRQLLAFSTFSTVEEGNTDVEYLKQCSSTLNDNEKLVTLMIDEIYAAQRIEYCNGAFVGLNEQGQPAKTVLTFMMQSTCGKYKDVVCLVLVNKLNTDLQKTWFNQVMLALHGLFWIVVVSVDNHVCNWYVLCNSFDGKIIIFY